MKKKRRKLKIESIIILLLIIIFLLCLIKLIIFLVDIRSNKKQNDDLVNDVISIKTEHNINTGEDEEKITIDFDKLLSINKDTVGWIRFNSDKVNYPIVHTNNNDYYLNRSFDGKINQAGSIFIYR